MNTANKITMIRVALIPVFLAVLYTGFPGSHIAAMVVFVLAGLTDIIDGYIARSRNQETNFGKFMDPLADKILVVSAMLWFTGQGIMPAWAALIVIIREFSVTALRLVAADSGRVIAAALSGKIKTAATMVCLIAMFFPLQKWMVNVCVAAITVTTVVSGVEYFVRNIDTINWEK